MDIQTLLPFIVGSIPVAILVITVFYKLFNFVRNHLSDEKQYEATVLKMFQKTEYIGAKNPQKFCIPARVDYYFITFRTSKHRRLKLNTNAETFEAVKKGYEGTLTLKGKKFIKFEMGL